MIAFVMNPPTIDDDWLDTYAVSICEAGERGGLVLELGCGSGRDTERLARLAHVVATDCRIGPLVGRSSEAVPRIVLDHSRKLPFRDSSFAFVVASLCLHYFPLGRTRHAVAELSRVLARPGYALVRLNSSNDTNYGAGSGAEIERNMYLVNGHPKRFFSEDEVRSLFREWTTLSLHETVIDRYEKPKSVWEGLFRISGGTRGESPSSPTLRR